MYSEEAKKVIDKADTLSKEFQAVVKKMDRVLFYLEDDDKTGQKGIISRLSDLEEKVRVLNIDKKINAGKMAVYVSIGSALLWLITNFDKILGFVKKASV